MVSIKMHFAPRNSGNLFNRHTCKHVFRTCIQYRNCSEDLSLCFHMENVSVNKAIGCNLCME